MRERKESVLETSVMMIAIVVGGTRGRADDSDGITLGKLAL